MARRKTTVVDQDFIAYLQRFAARLGELLDAAGYPRLKSGRISRLAADLGVSIQTARKWINGTALPGPMILTALARRTGRSIDFLLNGTDWQPPHEAGALPLPIFELREADAGTSFDLVTDLARGSGPIPGLPAQSDHCAFVRNWIDADDPVVRRDDLLLVDMQTSGLVENGVYLVRSASLVSVQRIRLTLGGNVVVSRVQSKQATEDVLTVEQIVFNERHDINAEPPSKGFLVVGKVVAVLRATDKR